MSQNFSIMSSRNITFFTISRWCSLKYLERSIMPSSSTIQTSFGSFDALSRPLNFLLFYCILVLFKNSLHAQFDDMALKLECIWVFVPFMLQHFKHLHFNNHCIKRTRPFYHWRIFFSFCFWAMEQMKLPKFASSLPPAALITSSSIVVFAA